MAEPAAALVSKLAGNSVTILLNSRVPVRPGRVFSISKLVFGVIAGLMFSLMQTSAYAQNTQSTAQNRSAIAVPDENTLARLVWSTMVALDNANRTENYTVLQNLGTDAFRLRNSPGQLAINFQDLRNNRVDIGRAILSSPTYYIPPHITQQGHLRLRGGFDYRPKSIRFDLLYSLEGGGWRITAMSVVEMDSNEPK